ncbi:hypothetical protein POM88_039243 [Heracleum sosnowskyi]|uniref:Uncharacterized protein n=1 Tax=Heracleum sosnowskyi TaxID=360622 RepID=A0AAD8H9L9_9APIA|nr:hypothetical protein POM88_039243 [Heracleum sosnowskyi]
MQDTHGVGPLQRKSRLDRVLTSNNWPLLENWELRANPRKESDHKKLSFQIKVVNWGPKPFKFFNAWLENDKFQCRIKHRLSKDKGERVANIQKIMKSIKEEAMSWNREENEDVYKNIERLELLISYAEDKSEDERKGLEQVENSFSMSEVMKGILALSSNQAQRDLLHSGNYSWVLGNGRSIYFWEDRWSGRGVLAEGYSRLYGICKWKYCSIEVIIPLFRNLSQNKEMWTRELRE